MSKMIRSELWVFCLLMVSVHSLVEVESKLKQLKVPNPSIFNWELLGCTADLYDQGNCNASYAYAVAAAIGTAYCVQKKQLAVFLSPKQIISCSGDYGNRGCDGGSAVNAFEYVKSTEGLRLSPIALIDVTEPSCNETGIRRFKIDGFIRYENVTEQFLIDLLRSKGPLVVGIDASLESFKRIGPNQVFNDPNCKSGPDDLTDDVLLTGIGTDIVTGTPYFEVVGSWGGLWGFGGRGQFARANNRCGIRTRVSYPVVSYQ